MPLSKTMAGDAATFVRIIFVVVVAVVLAIVVVAVVAVVVVVAVVESFPAAPPVVQSIPHIAGQFNFANAPCTSPASQSELGIRLPQPGASRVPRQY